MAKEKFFCPVKTPKASQAGSRHGTALFTMTRKMTYYDYSIP